MEDIDIRSSLSIEEQWKRSRSGARAGFGFRFQDAATTAAAILCWAGRIKGNAIIPESLDDFAIESQGPTVYVQVKSKISAESTFSASEIASFLATFETKRPTEASPEKNVTQIILTDRTFVGLSYENWNKSISDDTVLGAHLQSAVAARIHDGPIAHQILSTSALITWNSPTGIAASEIAKRRGVPFAAALACVDRLMNIVGQRTDANAVAAYSQRAKLTVGEIDREISATLNLIDSAAINAAVRKGLVEHLDFGTPLTEPSYYLGVATQAGHVTAGLTIPRSGVTKGIIETLFQNRRVLVTGPSGAGKSAAALMAAFETRHACRWIQVRALSSDDREDFLRFLSAQAPGETSPIALYVDNAGAGGGRSWEAALDASLTLPSVYLVATAREENLAVLSGLSHFTHIRPVLDTSFAERMWRQLRDQSATTWTSWQEPLERSKGLLLEYAHILTQGNRLQDVIAEQVKQRLIEKRDAEFEILRLTSAAFSFGASVTISLLAERLKLTNADCARSLDRLIDEHLVRRVGGDEVAGLHELRSECILETCLGLVPGSVADARREALAVVSAVGARTLIAAALRSSQLDEKVVIGAVVQRLRISQEPQLLIGALEGLKLSALDRDAEIFKAIADKHGIAGRFYFLITVAMHLREEKYVGSALEVLAKVRDEFLSKRGRDYRNDLLSALGDALYISLVEKVGSLPESTGLLRSLAGLELGGKAGPLRVVAASLTDASVEETAILLAIAEELSLELVRELVVRLGGAEKLLDRLFAETPWAIRPILSTGENGSTELQADLLAIEGRLINEPDSVVFDYASRALALAPEANQITARPILITGETITINDFTPGLKNFRRGNSASQATITWNRLLLHAVSLRYAASSITEVTQRQKELIEIAAHLFSIHADRRCRNKKLTGRQDAELKALNALQDILPTVPMDKPEVALSASEKANLTDTAGDLISDIGTACQRMYDASADGEQVASDMERIAKGVKSCRSDIRWNYVGGAPAEALEQIQHLAVELRYIFRAVGGAAGVAPSLVMMPSHQAWSRGTGMAKASGRARAQGQHKLSELKSRLAKSYSDDTAKVYVASAHLNSERSRCWPEDDICLLVECDSYPAYYEWLGRNIDALKLEARKITSLVIAPIMHGQIIGACALRIYPMGSMPESDFARRWGDHVGWPCFASPTLEAFEGALGNMLSVYAAGELLQGKTLLEAERIFLESCRDKSQTAMDELKRAFAETPTPLLAEATHFLITLNEKFRAAQDSATGEKPAVQFAREVMPIFSANYSPDTTLTVLGIRLGLIQRDIDRMNSRAA